MFSAREAPTAAAIRRASSAVRPGRDGRVLPGQGFGRLLVDHSQLVGGRHGPPPGGPSEPSYWRSGPLRFVFLAARFRGNEAPENGC